MDKNQIRIIAAVRAFIRDRFDLRADQAQHEVTIEEITKGVEFRGTNLWILIFAIFTASIGLNVNSTAVIIGAMLISPLMGPIMGIGLGAGINDVSLIRRAFKNLTVAAGISIITSAIYFFVTPLHEAQSELLARTYPTLWDVLIAFFGGLAGIVAGSRSQKSNAIPGVAIATALMPPLCTAGYGLANGNWYFFLGALFLFIINSVFISLSTFIIVRFLRFPTVSFVDNSVGKRVRFIISMLVFVTVVPSGYLAYNLVRQTIFEENARSFIANEFTSPQTQVISSKFDFSSEQKTISLTLYGKQLSAQEISHLQTKLINYNLESAALVVHQGYNEDDKLQLEELTRKMRTQVFEDLYTRSENTIRDKDQKIQLLEEELYKYKQGEYPTADISAELEVQYATLQSLAISTAYVFNAAEAKMDTVCLVLAKFENAPSKGDQQKIEEWLKVRTKSKKLEVVFK
jgi:uncharacterized hydrophobic protein (TIGR00271 family)